MKLIYNLPENSIQTIKKKIGEEPVLYCVPFDLSASGEFTHGWTVITKNRIICLTDEVITTDYTITEAAEFKAENLIGNGILTAVINGEDIILTRYSMKHVPRYAYIARILNDLKDCRETKIQSEDDEVSCLKCGRTLPEGTKICPSCTRKTAVLARLWKNIKIYRLQVTMVVGLTIIINAVNVLIPFINRILIDDYLIPMKRELEPILLCIGGIAFGYLINTIIDIIKGRAILKVGSNISRDMRVMIFSKIQTLSLSNLNKRKTGDLMNRVTGDTKIVHDFFQHNSAGLMNQIIVFSSVSLILFLTNWKLALFVLIPIPFVFLFCMYVRKKIMVRFRGQYKVWDKANSLLQDILSGIRVVKSFGQEEKEINRFKNASRAFADVTKRNEKMWNTIFPLMGFVAGFGQFIVLYYGGNLVIDHQLKLGELVQFSTYAGMLYGPLSWMSFVPKVFADTITAASRIYEIMDEEPEVKDNKQPHKINIKGNVKLKNVSFGYKSYEPVLKDINIEVAQGEMIGIVGLSGTGKSTLINLIMRFYDVDEGRILIDDVDIRDISQNSMRSQIGVVLQETFLFSGSILDNIRYTKPDSGLDEVIRAAKIANAHDFIIKFPDGYDTRIGENGYTLSGGERQRVAIARAVLCDPKILILDEATASLDTETEQQIQDALGHLVKNRTTFAIAHRLSTLRNANRLIVLDKGELAEMGTHEELLAIKGIYYKLVMAQRQMTKLKSTADIAIKA